MPLNPEPSPFLDHPIHLSGFTPLVEDCADGSILRALPEQTLCLPGELTRRATLILGLPGSGKTKRILERSVTAALSHPETSVVVFAVQPGSLNQAVAAARHFRGPDVPLARFNPGDASACTHSFNPLAGVSTKSEAKDIAHLLSQHLEERSRNSGDSQYFILHAQEMITRCILAVQQARGGAGTLGDVKDAIDGGGRTLAELAIRGENTDLKRFADECIGDSRNPQTTLTQMAGILSPWDDDEVKLTTSSNDLDFDDLLLRRPGLLVISVDEEKVPKLASLTSLVFRSFFAWIIRTARAHGGALPRHLLLFIDELPAAGRLPDFGTRLTATFRKSNVSCIAAAQCEAQIQAVYQEDTAAVLAGFGSRIYVPPVAPADAEALSARSGFIEVAHAVTGADGRLLSSNPLMRPLVLPGELAAPRHPVLGPRIYFHLADLPPFLGYLRGAWEIEPDRAIQQAAAGLPPAPGGKPTARARSKRGRKSSATPGSDGPSAVAGPDPGAITNTAGWSLAAIQERYRFVREQIGFSSTTGSARKWWETFEAENEQRPGLVLRLAEELAQRKATIGEFFLAYIYSNTDNIQANLHYLDYSRLKKEEGDRKKSDHS